MSDPIKLAQELKLELEKDPLIIEFRRVKSLMESDKEINQLKKDIALAKVHKDNKLHKELLERYHSHPLVANYETLQNEVSELLLEISKIVNKK